MPPTLHYQLVNCKRPYNYFHFTPRLQVVIKSPIDRHTDTKYSLVFPLSLLLLQGICPGNRLKIISYEPGKFSPSTPMTPVTPTTYNTSIAKSAVHLNTSDQYENTGLLMQKHGKRRSWHIMPNKVSEGEERLRVWLLHDVAHV
jgi:hypothetical protein